MRAVPRQGCAERRRLSRGGLAWLAEIRLAQARRLAPGRARRPAPGRPCSAGPTVGDVSDRQVFRSAGAVVLWWAWLVFAVASLVALAASGRGHSSVVTAFLVVAVTGVVYGCAWWPRIVADENGICVLNPLRGHAVPWPAVTNVDLINAVRVHAAPAPGAARGPVIYSWAVQSSARARLKSES